MMHVSYIHVFSFGFLKDIGLSLDHRFEFKMEEGRLRVVKTAEFLPSHFWNSGVYSLTAIVGNNGAGKTTVLRLMKHLFIQGAPRNEDADVLIVYEQQGNLYVYNSRGIALDASPDIHISEINQRRSIETLYYSGHFQPYTDDEDMELSGSFEASDGWLLVKDLHDYANVDTLHLSEPLYNHLSAYYAQNNYRICEVLALEGLRDLLQTVRLPRFVQFAPNRGGWNAIKLDRMGRYEGLDIPAERLTSRDLKEQALERIVYYDILNLIVEGKGEAEELCEFLKEWIEAPKDDGVVTALEHRMKVGPNATKAHKSLGSLHYVIQKIESLCEFDDKSQTFYVDVVHEGNKLRGLIDELIRSPYFLTARFFDIIYSHNLVGSVRLSSGEQELLNLLSRLYYGITIRPQKFHDIEPPRLLLLDEAEIGFHPEWQRQYIKMLNEFMGYMRVKVGVDFQIVLTSHSPIILSDLPVRCVNFLKREGDKTELVSDEKETYGENVFNLYRRAFFMKDGLIGAFANDRLRHLFDKALRGENDDDMMKEVELIGDERIKDALLYEIGNHHYDAAKRYYQQKLEELDRRRANEEDRPE